MPENLVFLLLIAFWTPGSDKPMVQGDSFKTVEECDAAGMALDKEWLLNVNGGSTSWICIGAYPVPSQ